MGKHQTVYISDDNLIEHWTAEAVAQDVSKSHIIQQALHAHLKDGGDSITIDDSQVVATVDKYARANNMTRRDVVLFALAMYMMTMAKP
jgi:malate/lactate dehydrogenase